MSYLQFNKPQQIEKLNQNDIYDKKHLVIFPNKIYDGHLLQPARYTITYSLDGHPAHGSGATYDPRNTYYDYFMCSERDKHPDVFTHFNYANGFRNGYGSGHFPGFFNTSPYCSETYDPPNMALPKYYRPLPYYLCNEQT